MLVVAMPGRAETRGLVSREVIDALGTRYLFNVSRGSTVDESTRGGNIGWPAPARLPTNRAYRLA
jgi:hypothetical protein